MTEVRFAELTRACAQTGGVVSYQSAAQVYAMGDFHPHFLHVTASGPAGASRTVAIHQQPLPAVDICDLGSFRVTTPLRTLLDLAASPLSQAVLDRTVVDAVAIGRIVVEELSASASAQPARVASRLRKALQAVS